MTPYPSPITGIGAVSALGFGSAAIWSALAEGRDGIRPIERFETEGFPTALGATVPLDSHPELDRASTGSLAVAFAVAAAREAISHAGLTLEELSTLRTALVLGASPTQEEPEVHELTRSVARELGLAPLQLTLSTACTSSANALIVGREILRAGLVDIVIAGGMDVLTQEFFAGFCRLGVVCPTKCAPFSQPVGTSLGEGAGILVLESPEHARARGASAVAFLTGGGSAADGYHETSPDPTGAGIARAIRAGLHDAGLSPDAIGYVNAHGTGTEHNDVAEWFGIQGALGDGDTPRPISSTKSVLGHGQAAAGALEVVATLLAMDHGAIPQTLRFREPRPRGPLDPVGSSQPRPLRPAHVLSTNAAFGGSNTALVLSRSEGPHTPGPAPRRVRILGGARADAGDDRQLQTMVRGADLATFNPAARYLTGAAARALNDAGVRVRGDLRSRAGLVVGTTRLSAQSAEEFDRSIEERGLHELSVRAFSQMVLNAPAGAASRALSLRGSHMTLSTGRGSGLVAVALAALSLQQRQDDALTIAGGFDEPDQDADGQQGAACLVLSSELEHPGGQGVELAGVGIATDSVTATATALERAGLGPAEIHKTFAASEGELPACRGLYGALEALEALRSGHLETALVTTGRVDGAACALVLTAGRPQA